jgi:hypothetical protein
MDDGTQTSSGLRLCLQAFSFDDLVYFCSFLKSEYGLAVTLQASNSSRTQWYLYIRKQSMGTLTT